jgi:hypothetical protein
MRSSDVMEQSGQLFNETPHRSLRRIRGNHNSRTAFSHSQGRKRSQRESEPKSGSHQGADRSYDPRESGVCLGTRSKLNHRPLSLLAIRLVVAQRSRVKNPVSLEVGIMLRAAVCAPLTS